MHPIWVIQLGVDVMLLGLVCWWLWDRRRHTRTHEMQQRLRATLSVLEERVEKQEAQWRELTSRVHAQIRQLDKICDEAARILERGQTHLANPTPTREEKELLAMVSGSDAEAIPKLRDVDDTRKRLKRERLFDLAKVLGDQLA